MDYKKLNDCFNVFNLAKKEVRAIKKTDGKPQIFTGWFSTVTQLINAIELNYSEKTNWHFVFNEVTNYTRDGLIRCLNGEGVMHSAKHTTQDKDIARRSWVMVDFDPVRKSDTSSTQEQLQLACDRAKVVWDFLFHNGFREYVGCISGNGYHLMLPCDMECNEKTDSIVRDFLQVISMLFSTEEVEIDTAVFNRARLTKLYGTKAHKGVDCEETPHRMSYIKHSPARIVPIPTEYFEKIVSAFKSPVKYAEKYNNFGKRSSFDIVSFLKDHNIGYTERSIAGGTKYILNECVFNSEHKKPDSAVFQFSDGSLGFKCFHNSCSHYHWKEFRQKVDPTWVEGKVYSPEDYNEMAKVVINVDEEWVEFNKINCEAADSVMRIPSGFKDLDRCLGGGMASGGLTVLTGVNGCGKTVFLNNMILNICDKGFKTGLFSGEMQSWRIKTWLLKIARGLHTDNEENNGLISESLKDKLFVYNNSFGNEWERLFESVKVFVESKEINFLVLDNLACMRLRFNKWEKLDQQSNFIKELADYARLKCIHVVLVAHPRKSYGVVRKDDIAGSYDLSNMADNVLIMHKVNDDFLKHSKELWNKDTADLYSGYDSLIEVAKNRDMGDELVIGLFYERYSKRLKNSFAETIHYEWEKSIKSELFQQF